MLGPIFTSFPIHNYFDDLRLKQLKNQNENKINVGSLLVNFCIGPVSAVGKHVGPVIERSLV
jgi:hypothetical protein